MVSDSGWEHGGHVCGPAQVLIVHEEGDAVGAEGTKHVRGPSPGLPVAVRSCPAGPHPQPPSPDHDIRLKHSSSTFGCLPQGHQGVLGGQLGNGIGEEVAGEARAWPVHVHPALLLFCPPLTMGAPRCPTSAGLRGRFLGSMIQGEEMHRGTRKMARTTPKNRTSSIILGPVGARDRLWKRAMGEFSGQKAGSRRRELHGRRQEPRRTARVCLGWSRHLFA